jgi:glucose/arabinose dehydrogenase
VSSVGHTETDIFLRIYARAVDSEGLVDTAFVDVDPRLVSLEIATVPAGLEVTVDGQPRTTPVTIPSVVGMERALGAPSPQAQSGTSYTFSAWSQGGSATQAYVTPEADVALTATFTGGGASNQPPTVSITEPAGGATVTVGASVTVSAQASDPDGTVTTVQFREGSTVIGSDDTAPYSIQWTPGTTGTRSLTARATDDDGATTTSAVVQVTVQSGGGGDVTPPTATLTAPVQGTRGLTGSVSLSATASDNVGVTSVEFQVDGETLATDAAAPYTATLPSTSAFTTGAHTFRARARDAAGNWSPWSSATVTFGGNVNLPAGFVQEVVASGFTHPASTGILTTAAFAPDGRLFILEQLGRVHVLKNGAILPTPFVELTADPDQERGLLGIAFHPDFPASPYVYLYYTTNGSPAHNRISRFTANGDVAVPGSELVIVDLDPLTGGGFHNGGAMAFGPDGKLYVAVGDNGLQAQSQSLSSRLGKMLRYNPDGTIPTDNPFYSTATGANRAIWAYGLRNPYTFGFHPDTGRMHINDVGNGAWEEINLGVAGGNYGWPATEGPTTNPAYESPILAYAHGDPESPTLFSGASILGSAFYDPPVVPFGAGYVDDYFFADYVSGWIYRMDSDEWDTAYAFARLGGGITNLAVGPDGALYVLWGSTAQGGSRVVRISRP